MTDKMKQKKLELKQYEPVMLSEECAKFMRVPIQTFYSWVRRGLIPAAALLPKEKNGTQGRPPLRISRDALWKLIEETGFNFTKKGGRFKWIPNQEK